MNKCPALVALTLVGACTTDVPLGVRLDGGNQQLLVGSIAVPTASSIKSKVDILFMIDDSPSMQPKQSALRDRFPELMAQLDAYAITGSAASYHIGVITSDLGSPNAIPGCANSLGGKLQALGRAAAPGCVGPTSGSFLVYDQLDHSNDNVPSGRTLAQTFTCMASVTSEDGTIEGCGLESQLESVYVALHEPPPENAGFLRDDALLVVVYITDEDDCSMVPTSNLDELDTSVYGPLTSFRCTQFGISCDGQFPLSSSPSSYASCTPAGTDLTDVNKYVDFFTLPASRGGIKADPRDVVLVAIDAPTTPFATATATGTPCEGSPSCTQLDHSCFAPSDPTFFGDPAVRIQAVVSAVPSHQTDSICDVDDTSAMDAMATQIISALQTRCLDVLVANPATPDCAVDDASTQPDGTVARTAIPACDEARSVLPCWHAVTLDQCPGVLDPTTCTMQKFGIDVDRGGAQAPVGSAVEATCATFEPTTQAACPG